jgi:hypothetical protein
LGRCRIDSLQKRLSKLFKIDIDVYMFAYKQFDTENFIAFAQGKLKVTSNSFVLATP